MVNRSCPTCFDRVLPTNYALTLNQRISKSVILCRVQISLSPCWLHGDPPKEPVRGRLWVLGKLTLVSGIIVVEWLWKQSHLCNEFAAHHRLYSCSAIPPGVSFAFLRLIVGTDLDPPIYYSSLTQNMSLHSRSSRSRCWGNTTPTILSRPAPASQWKDTSETRKPRNPMHLASFLHRSPPSVGQCVRVGFWVIRRAKVVWNIILSLKSDLTWRVS
jgi:hypothetical protein